MTPVAIASPLLSKLLAFSHLGTTMPDADPHDDEFGGIGRADADLDIQPPLPLLLERVQGVVDADVVGLRRLFAEQRAVRHPLRQKVSDGPPQLRPQGRVVRLEHRPTYPILDRLFQEQEQPTDVDVLQLRSVAVVRAPKTYGRPPPETRG